MATAPAYPVLVASSSTETCRTCKAAPQKPCVALSGVSKGKPLAAGAVHPVRLAVASYVLGYADGEPVGAASRQPELDAVTAQNTDLGKRVSDAAEDITTLQGTIADLQARIHDLTKNVWAIPGAAALGAGTFPAPEGYFSVPVTPGGVSAAIKANVTAHPKLAIICAGGSYSDTWSTPAGSDVIFLPKPATALNVSEQVWFDGGNKLKRQMTATGRVRFRGIGARNYAPPFGTADGGHDENSENVPFYFGGRQPGSGFEDCWLTKSTGNFFKILTDEPVVRRCTIEDVGHTPFFLSGDRALIEDTLIRRYNTKGYDPEPQSAAFKLTDAVDLVVRNVAYEDGNGAHGAWLDAGCVNFTFVHIRWNGVAPTGSGRANMKNGITLELSEKGLLVDVAGAGCTSSGVVCLDTGHVDIWNSDLRGNAVGWKIYQDRRSSARTDCPMKSLGNQAHNVDFDGPYPIRAYDSGKVLDLLGTQILTVVEGCTFAAGQGPELGHLGGGLDPFDSASAMSKIPAANGGPFARAVSNQFGGDPKNAPRVAVSADVAAVLVA